MYTRPARVAIVASLTAGWVALLTAQQASQSQSSQPTFRVDTNAVILDARVVDRDGRFVSDLTQADFRVFEDDVEQTVTSFSIVTIPIPPTADVAPLPIADPDVASNARSDAGRLYVIVLDDLEGEVEELVYGQIQRSANTRSLARDFVENHLSDVDRAALMTTSGRKDMAVQFTNNRRRLIESIEKFQGGYGQIFFMRDTNGGLYRDNLHLVMESLRGLSDWLTDPGLAARRKGIVLISQRLSRTMAGIPNLQIAERERVDVDGFLRTAARANASLYAVDPVGVPTGPDGTLKPVWVDDGAAFDLDRIAGLVAVSEATGGFAVANTNNFRPGFTRIVEENSSYYLLGYTSKDSRRDNRFRRIRVEVTRPGLEVRTRSGYTAARPSTNRVSGSGNLPADLAELTRSPVPVSGLTLTVTAAPFRREGSRATVAVVLHARVNPSSLTTGFNQRSTGSMQIAVLAADMDGRTRGERGTLNMNLSPRSREVVAEHGVRLLSSIDLSPGEYQLSVAASDGLLRGSVRYDVTVPDFNKPLAMSGIALGSTLMAGVPTRGPEERWRKSMGMIPTTDRVFRASDELRMFVEVYDNERREHQTHITATVQTNEGRKVFGYTEPLKLVRGQATYPVVLPISLLAMQPGGYILTVEARSSAMPNEAVLRQIPFSVQ